MHIPDFLFVFLNFLATRWDIKMNSKTYWKFEWWYDKCRNMYIEAAQFTFVSWYFAIYWFTLIYICAYRFYGRKLKFEVKITSFGIKMKCTQKFKGRTCNFLHCGQKSTRVKKERKEDFWKKGKSFKSWTFRKEKVFEKWIFGGVLEENKRRKNTKDKGRLRKKKKKGFQRQ